MKSLLGGLLNRAPDYVGKYGSNLISLSKTGRSDTQQLASMSTVSTLYAIVSRISESTSELNWRLYRKMASGERKEISRHAALDLWGKPNKFFTQQELVESVQQHVELTGMGWMIVSYASGSKGSSKIPLELWPVRPDRMVAVPDQDEFIKGYIYTSPDGVKVPFELDEVINIRVPNPMDVYGGLSAVSSIMTDIESSQYSRQYNRNFFRNSAEPGGIIEVDKKLGDTEFEQLRDRWNSGHKGVGNAHRVAILEHGKWIDRKYTMRDMQFAELRNLSREDIREAFGYPKPMLGATDDVNRANAEAGEYVFTRWILRGRARRWKDALNSNFLPLFGKEASMSLEFDFDDPVPSNRELDNATLTTKVAAAASLIDQGFDPVDVLAMLELPEMATVTQPDAPVSEASTDQQRHIAELIQKMYLGVGTIVTWNEARAILNKFGADLDLDAPAPVSVPPSLTQGRHVAISNTTRVVINQAIEQTQADWERALAGLLEDWATITDSQRAELYRQIRDAVDDNNPTALAELGVDTSTAADLLDRVANAVAAQAAARVAEDAGEQGVSTDPGQADENHLAGVAAAAAALLGIGLAVAAGQEALRVLGPESTGRGVASHVDEHLASLSTSYLHDRLGGVLTTAQNAGRFATMESAPTAAYYATEANDSNTCGPCQAIDDRRFDTLDQAKAVYAGGGYVDCLGRDRCRGTVVAIWEDGE